jgi:hypothetical protein
MLSGDSAMKLLQRRVDVSHVMGMPTLKPSIHVDKQPAGFYHNIQRAQIHMQNLQQKQQIDGAIKLLQMEYNTIMSRVNQSQGSLDCKLASRFELPVNDCSSNIQIQKYKDIVVLQPNAAHRKRGAEDMLNGGRKLKKSVPHLSGKAFLDAKVNNLHHGLFRVSVPCVDIFYSNFRLLARFIN